MKVKETDRLFSIEPAALPDRVNFRIRLLAAGMTVVFLLFACRLQRPGLTPQTQALPAVERTPTSTPVLTLQPTGSASPTQTPAPTLVEAYAGLGVDKVDQLRLLDTLVGHSDVVLDLAFSPSSEILASSAQDGTILLWDLSTGAVTTFLEDHQQTIHSLGFSPNGELLASGSDDGTVRVWEVETGQLLRTIDSQLLGRILKVAFSPDGLFIAMADHQCLVEIRRVSTGILHRTLPQANCRVRTSGSVGSWGMEFTSDGNQILLGEGRPCCNAGSIFLWDLFELKSPVLVKGFGYVVKDFSLSPNENQIAVALVGVADIPILSLPGGEELTRLEGHDLRVNSLDFATEGNLLASGSRDRTVRLWDATEGLLLRTLSGHSEAVTVVRISPDGRWLATGSGDHTVQIWGLQE